MTGTIVIRNPRARVDLAGCYAYLDELNPVSAARFLKAVEATLTALARSPGIGARFDSLNPGLAGVRVASIRRFKNYLVIYRPIDGGIEVLRVLHAARDIDAILDAEED